MVNSKSTDIDSENIHDRISMLEDDVQLLQTEHDALQRKISHLRGDLTKLRLFIKETNGCD